MMRLSLIVLIIVNLCAGARILGVIPTPSYSHQIIFQPIFEELAKRGHDVVVMTTNPVKNPALPNLKEIDWSEAYNVAPVDIIQMANEYSNPFTFIAAVYKAFDKILTYEFEHPEVLALIRNETEHFDVVMIEFLLPTMFAFKHRFNCPFIGITSVDAPGWAHTAVGNSVHQVLYPDASVPFAENLDFFQRMTSLLLNLAIYQYTDKFYIDGENKKVKKVFGEGYPDLRDIINSVDMLFINTNLAVSHVRPVTPSTISIGGGIHIKDPKPLPKDLQTYLDNSKSGVIYFSLGSNVKSVNLPNKTQEIILNVLSKLPFEVLWKFEAEEMPHKSKNIKIQKWIPQQDVLRHPNVKAFITQGGLQSLEEALFSHIPLVVLPFFGDQEFNANKVASKGMGIHLNYKTMTSDSFEQALLEVIYNPMYKNNVKKLATLVADEPMNALQKGVWWTEYVIRNKGAQHLKGPGLNLPLYQYYYLDIFAFIIGLFIIIIGIVYWITKKILRGLCKLVCSKKMKVQ